MKIAIVHDFLREYGGAERVVEALHEIWPGAPLYTSFVDWPAFAKAPAGKLELFKSWDIRTSWVQHNWFVKKFHSPLRFLAPNIWESLDLSEYDIVITSSGWFMCRGVRVHNEESGALRGSLFDSHRQGPDRVSLHGLTTAKAVTMLEKTHRAAPVHICYIHHPPRNLYGYATGSDLQKYWPVRVYATIINFFLRHYDFMTAQKVDYFVANSKETARRVEKFYRRDSTVMYPPVEVKSQKEKGKSNTSYYVSVGRLTYAKRIDLAIEACNKLKLPLKIVGSGKEEAYLRSIAGPTVDFLGSVSDDELDKIYTGAKALIFCALDEDFGMVPVEAMAHGVPVIALAQGGVLETVIDGKTGMLFGKPEVESLVAAINKFYKRYNHYNFYKNCLAQAKKFSKERFQKEFKTFVEQKYRLASQ